MQICTYDKCTGCYACVSVCPHHCIKMQEDEMGELHPIVDENSCRHCNLCVQVCPNNTKLEYRDPMECLASWITDQPKRSLCASGGIGTAMSEYVIANGGVVFGSRYDQDMNPIISYTETMAGLEYFKGSRYVQSLVGEKIFKQVGSMLKAGRRVIFIGTSCQIAGLKTFLHKDYEELITVDLICHGVCPTAYLKKEVSYLAQRNNYKNVTDIRFRGNDGNNFCLSLWNDKKMLYRGDRYCQFYLAGFLLGVSMRECCYTCNYARPQRISDITIGDFIGLGRKVPFKYSSKNVSSVLINTEKGMNFYKGFSSATNSLIDVERQYEERLEYGPSLQYPFPRHKLNAVFRKNYQRYGYVKAIRKTLFFFVWRKRVNKVLQLWTYLYRIPRKIFRQVIYFFQPRTR
jgi:coenzyme F420-reducing hydrogenase beta subunit